MEGLTIEVVLPSAEQIRALDGAELDAALWELELVSRRVEAARAEVVGRADRRAHYLADGHRGVKGWAMAVTNCSPAEAAGRDRTARLVQLWPQIGDQLRAAEIGVAQVQELAKLAANPRCGERLPESGQVLVDAAKDLQFADFRTAVQRWEQLADADGAHRQHEASLERRNVSIVEVGGEFEIRGRLPVIAGTILREILGHFADAEFHADYDAAKANYPDSVTITKSMLERSAAQRRADALSKIFDTAATAGIAGKPVEMCVNLVMTEDQFERQLREQIDGMPVAIDPATVLEQRCETADGVPIDPRQAVALALLCQVRRIVLDSNGIVINAGRRQRCFSPAVREILRTLRPRCTWLGCMIRAAVSQVDHLQGYAHGGLTDAANAKITCEHHNLFKHRNGYQPQRDETGVWHLHRPNGTKMQPPDAA